MSNQRQESFIALGHELIHVYHNIFGGKDDKRSISKIEDKKNGVEYEEYYTVGLNPTDAGKNPYINILENNIGALTENGLRIENGMPLRGGYVLNSSVGEIARILNGAL